jgi:hypothetical protein
MVETLLTPEAPVNGVQFRMVPNGWRALHSCSNFSEPNVKGQCVFCVMNEELEVQGMEAIPFDVPGAYDGKGEPNILIQKLQKPS